MSFKTFEVLVSFHVEADFRAQAELEVVRWMIKAAQAAKPPLQVGMTTAVECEAIRPAQKEKP